MFKTFLFAVAIGSCLMLSSVEAQHHPIADTYRDYCKNVPRQFSPDDPWTMGWVLRTEVGFGGLFFNCDGEALKRYSPYIRWNCQNMDCPKRLIQDPLLVQLAEVKQRVRWGSCGQCGAGCRCKGCQPVQNAPCNCNGVAENQMPVLSPAQRVALSQVVTKPASAQVPAEDERDVQRLLQQSRRAKKQPYATRSGIPATTTPSRQQVVELYDQSNPPAAGTPAKVVRYNPNPTPPLPRMTPQQSAKKTSFLSKILNPMAPKSPAYTAPQSGLSTASPAAAARTANVNPLPPQPTKQLMKQDSGFQMLRR